MGTITRENIEWAARTLDSGGSLEFVASVLETSPKRARGMIDTLKRGRIQLKSNRPNIPLNGRHVWRSENHDVSAARKQAEALFANEHKSPEIDDESTDFDDTQNVLKSRKKDFIEREAMAKERAAVRRRKFLLAARYSKWWDMIWFLTATGMCDHTIRRIYTPECVRWARGHGIDVEIR